MIANTINQKIGEALKAHDEVRVSTLRMLSSAFNYEKIAKQHDLSEEEELTVVRKEAKKRKDAVVALHQVQGKSTFEGASIDDRIKKEEEELKILQEYLPAEMNDEELNNLVDDSISKTSAKTIQDMGKVIGMVMSKAQGAADGAKVAELIKKKLGIV